MKNKEFKVLLMDINKNTYEEYGAMAILHPQDQ